MLVSLNWLSAMLGRNLDADDVARRLTDLGANVESTEQLHQGLGDIVVGVVEHAEKHPNADRLTLCRVNDGNGVVDVVCGAPNVRVGGRYPYARVGTTLPVGIQLTARKIRGVVSNGMLCSAKELGLGEEHEGILELATDVAGGTPLLEVLPVADVRLEIEVTANRPDLLGIRGVARELAAAYDTAVRLPPIPGAPAAGEAPRRVERSGAVDGVEIVLEDAAGCPRYMGAVIRGVKIAPSPPWLDARLRSVGARPINNVVDATNYVLFELNQPLHAFDVRTLGGSKIVVRQARAGEQLVTLDGETRRLERTMTMICDAERATAIAGVMGGGDSEVSPETTDVLIECAYFDPKSVRRTRQTLKMSTEASYRFERGTDLEAMPDVLRRAVQLIRAVAGGEEREAPLDVYPRPAKPRIVVLRPERVTHVLGVAIPREEIEQSLVRLGFPVAPKGDRLHVQVPGWRPDVTREIDLIEEVARFRGYDSFPVELHPFRPSVVPDDPAEPARGRLRRAFTAFGLHEARSLSLTSAAGRGAWHVLNPLSADEATLRPDLLTGLVRSVERNWAARERDVRLFEIGSVFLASDGPQPREVERMAAVVTGGRVPPHWSDGGKTPSHDDWDIEWLFREAVRLAGPAGEIVPVADGWELRNGSTRIGWAGRLDADAPAWAAPLFGFEVDLAMRPAEWTAFRPLPTTPPVERDVALVLPAGVTATEVERVVRAAAGPLLADLRIFDEYRGRDLAGRSVAWRLTFRAPDRTLRDEDADRAVDAILRRLQEELGVERRRA